MDLAIRKAKDVGIAWVNCTGEFMRKILMFCHCGLRVDDLLCASPRSGSNHYGIAGWYAIRAAKEGLIVSDSRCACVRVCVSVLVLCSYGYSHIRSPLLFFRVSP